MSETKLRAALIEARDWFESQAKAVSKGCGSSYELHDLRMQRDALNAALAAPAQAVPAAPGQARDAARVFWQQHTQADALSMTMAELHDDVEIVIRAARGAAQAAKGLARVPLTDEQVQDLLQIGNPTEEETRLIQLGWNAAHGIK